MADGGWGGGSTEHELEAEEIGGFFERRGQGFSENHAGREAGGEALGKVLRGELRQPLILGADVKQDGVDIGRQAELFAELEFLAGEAFVVVAPGELDGGAMRSEGLNEDLADAVAAAGAAGDLSQELEGAFAGAEIGKVEAEIGVEDSDQSDIGKIEAFGDHLRPDEDVEAAGAESFEGVAESVLPAHGVGIDAGDAGVGEDAAEDVFGALRAEAGEADGRGAALGAVARGHLLKAADVADEAFL